MTEYKIITGKPETLQKILNQWRHDFELDILSMTTRNDTIVILLTRKRLE